MIKEAKDILCKEPTVDMPNCWEVRKCGKEKDCPAYPYHGRMCFAVTGTCHNGEDLKTFSRKLEKCRACKVYWEVVFAEPWP
ncbi:two-CW domain-containing protein [Thermodesulfobacteriota bacterium]